MSDSQPAASAVPAAPVGDDVALAIRGLVKIYGNLVAVADLSLDIPTGSFYGIVGPNGAGKTTTLTMATGMPPSPASAPTSSSQPSTWPRQARS